MPKQDILNKQTNKQFIIISPPFKKTMFFITKVRSYISRYIYFLYFFSTKRFFL